MGYAGYAIIAAILLAGLWFLWAADMNKPYNNSKKYDDL
jgi:hypothetical protein